MKSRPGQYGAWELKTGYRRTVVLGFACAVLVHAAAVAIIRHLPRASDPPPTERLIRAVRAIPRLNPPGGLPIPMPAQDGRGAADVIANGGSDIPAPAGDADVEPEFAVRKVPVEVLPFFDEPQALHTGALLVHKITYRAAEHQRTRATVYGQLDAAGVDVPPEIIEKIQPEYPPQGLSYFFNADVVIRVLIGCEGRVDKAFVVVKSGVDMGFEESALSAVTRWLFHPAVKDGRSVPMWIDVPIAYRLVVSYGLPNDSKHVLQTRVIF